MRGFIVGRILRAIAGVVTFVIAAGFLASAFSGMISPTKLGIASIAAMTFPAWLLGLIAITVIDLIWWKRLAIIGILSMIICFPQIYNFMPLNLPNGKMNEEQQARSFTLMSYNVWQFANQDPDYPFDTNAQLDYIMKVSADVVVIVEASCMLQNDRTRITQDQLAALNEMYPYIYIEGEEFAFLSKYEAESIPVNFPKKDFRSGDIAGWRFYKDGEPINVFGVHLASYSLGPTERSRFKEMTTPENVKEGAGYLREVRSDFMPKIVEATKLHTEQMIVLKRILQKYGGTNAIICGDFNDPVGSYPLHYLEEYCDMKQVYPEVGFGPMITYNANHFFFRIDHILYRGNLEPWSMGRGKLKASDHYPIIATFLLKDEAKKGNN